MPDNVDDVLAYAWGEYRVWAATSRRLKGQIDRYGKLVLGLTLAGTALGTVGPFLALPPSIRQLMPWVSAIALGMATFLAAQLLSESSREAWVKSRAVAEAVKSEAYLYLTRTAPYDTAEAGTRLTDKISELLQSVTGVLAESVSDQERVRGVPGPATWTLPQYIDGRIRDQIAFYSRAIERHREAVTRARLIAIALGGISVILSASGSRTAASGSVTWVAAMLGTVTTAAAAIGSWYQSGNHLQNALSYQTAKAKLERLLAQHAASSRAASLVQDAEAILQAEHAGWLTQWRAEKEREPPGTRPEALPKNREQP